MSKETFNPGEYVVYPTHGVGKVVSVTKDKIAGQDLELIAITFDKDRMTLRIPMINAQKTGLRALSSKDVMNEALETLKGKAKVKRTMWSRRAQEYEAKINSGDPVSIAEVVRDLYKPSEKTEQSYSERQIYEQALDRLASELAAVDKTNSSEAENKLYRILKMD